MIVEKEFIKKLSHQLGLNIYEAKLWTALLSRGVSTAGELSDIANVPRSRSYDVLETLQKKGFIIQKLGKPIKYVALPPAEVLERVKKALREDADKQVQTIESLKDSDVLKELDLLHTKGIELVEPSDMAGSIRGRSSVYDQMEMMLKDAEDTIVIMTTEQGLIAKIDAFRKQLQKAKERGVSIRILCPKTDLTTRKARELDGIADVRFSDVTARFVIVDSKEIVFMLLDDEKVHPSYEVGVWLNTPFFTTALVSMFTATFEHAITLKTLMTDEQTLDDRILIPLRRLHVKVEGIHERANVLYQWLNDIALAKHLISPEVIAEAAAVRNDIDEPMIRLARLYGSVDDRLATASAGTVPPPAEEIVPFFPAMKKLHRFSNTHTDLHVPSQAKYFFDRLEEPYHVDETIRQYVGLITAKQ